MGGRPLRTASGPCCRPDYFACQHTRRCRRHSLPSRSHRCNAKHSHRLHRGRRSSPPWLCRELQSAGGNITGISLFNNILSMKRIGLLHELVPMADVVAMLINPKSPILEEDFEPVQETARSLGLTIHVLNA